jgi:hypothetical protein
VAKKEGGKGGKKGGKGAKDTKDEKKKAAGKVTATTAKEAKPPKASSKDKKGAKEKKGAKPAVDAKATKSAKGAKAGKAAKAAATPPTAAAAKGTRPSGKSKRGATPQPEELFEGPVYVRSTSGGAVKMIGLRRTIGANVYEYYGMEAGYRLSGPTVGVQVNRFVTRIADVPAVQTFAQFQAWAAPLLPAGAKDWFEHQVWTRE